ncbi:MAG: hypothetical protein ACTJHC_09485 [Vagococcus sp.]
MRSFIQKVLKDCQMAIQRINVESLMKNKKIIGLIVGVILSFIILNIVVTAVRPSIREQEMQSVALETVKNKQVVSINEEQLSSYLKKEADTFVALIDKKDNPSYKELRKMFNNSKGFEQFTETIYMYQPIYDVKNLSKQYHLTNKNTFIHISDGKEQGRFSFDTLKTGEEELFNQLNLMLNPKIQQRKPIRVEKDPINFDSEPKEETQTSEIIFDN